MTKWGKDGNVYISKYYRGSDQAVRLIETPEICLTSQPKNTALCFPETSNQYQRSNCQHFLLKGTACRTGLSLAKSGMI
jgi:hypothetical protein